jgi:hypothetical protein
MNRWRAQIQAIRIPCGFSRGLATPNAIHFVARHKWNSVHLCALCVLCGESLFTKATIRKSLWVVASTTT